MPQHDLDIANASGAAVRADINNALGALGSMMKGPTAPSAPVAGMLWLEDDNPSSTRWTIRQYDGSDWISWGVLDSTANRIEFLAHGQNRTDAPSVAQIQDGALVWAGTTAGTATAITASLTPAISTYVTGMTIAAKIGTACDVNPTLNVNGVGAKKIYVAAAGGPAQASIGDLFAGDLAAFRYDAALDSGAGGWLITSAPAAGERLIGRWEVSGSSQLIVPIQTPYTFFRLRLSNFSVTTADASLLVQFSNDGGATFISASNYRTEGFFGTGAAVNPYSVSNQTQGEIAPPRPANEARFFASYEIAPGSASSVPIISGSTYGIISGPAWNSGRRDVAYDVNGRMNALRLYVSSGTWTGAVALIGTR